MKLIASDLDGTLLNEKEMISDENVKAIEKALQQGIEVLIATGRDYHSAHDILKEAGLSLPIICLNGAMTYTKDKTLLSEIPMDRDIVRKIQQRCKEEQLYFEVFSQETAHSISKDDFHDVLKTMEKIRNPLITPEFLSDRAKERMQEPNVVPTPNYQELFANEGLHFYKILAFSLDQTVLNTLAAEFQDEPSLKVTSSGDINIEFNHIDAQKGQAVTNYAKQQGIEMEDVMAIGDHFNDESMIKLAGRGVAMGNANETIKNIASHQTTTNQEDGVAQAIKDILREQN